MSYRQGIFTSSGAHKLIKLDAKGGFQKAGKTYIDQKEV